MSTARFAFGISSLLIVCSFAFAEGADSTAPRSVDDSSRKAKSGPRILFNSDGGAKTLLQLVQEKNREQGRSPATRADLRFGTGPDGQIFLLNKRDGTIRLLVP